MGRSGNCSRRRQGRARLCPLRLPAPPPCPTYVVLGDERDGPRGRIQFMQKMLEQGGEPTAEAVHHIDRCLSCLNCRTTCPSSVDYARLVDKARAHIHENYKRPFSDRLVRWLVAKVFPYPAVTKIMLGLVPLGRIAAKVLPLDRRLVAMLKKAAPPRGPELLTRPEKALKRIALLPGCVQKAIGACRSMRRCRACWRGAASSWCRWKARAAAARSPIIWAASMNRKASPRS